MWNAPTHQNQTESLSFFPHFDSFFAPPPPEMNFTNIARAAVAILIALVAAGLTVKRVPVNSYCYRHGYTRLQRFPPSSSLALFPGQGWGCLEFVNDTDVSGPYLCKTRDMRVVVLPNISVHNGYAPDIPEARMGELYITFHVPKNPTERRSNGAFVPEDKMIHVHFQIVLNTFCAGITSSQALQPQMWDAASEHLGASLQARVPHGVRTYYVRVVSPPVYVPRMAWHGLWLDNVESVHGAMGTAVWGYVYNKVFGRVD